MCEAELQHLHTLVAARLATSVTLGIYALSKDPSNEYLKLHAVPGRRALAAILDIPSTDFLAMARQVLRESDTCSASAPLDEGHSSVSIARCIATAAGASSDDEPFSPVPTGAADDAPTITFVTGNKKKLEEVTPLTTMPSPS